MALLRIEAAALIAYAIVLAVAVPPLIARSGWPSRAPRAALVLWQAVGLGGGLALVSAGLTLAAADLDGHWLSGIGELPDGWSRLGALGWIGVAVTAVSASWLLTVLVTSTARTVRARRDHRRRLDLLTDDLIIREHGDSGTEIALVRLLDHADAAAYCLPGLRPQIVLSSGTVASLSTPQLAAVVVHERAHARGRHDLVIHPFRAWRETFPFVPATALALREVELLVEMLADDAARDRTGTTSLVGALERLTATGRSEAELTRRVGRLTSPRRPFPVTARIMVYAAATALVVGPPLLLALS